MEHATSRLRGLCGLALLLAACQTAPSTAPATTAPPLASVAPASPASLAPASSPLATGSAVASPSAVTGASPTAGSAAREKMTVAYASPSPSQAPAWIAEDEGFFDQNGLDVDLTSIPGGSSPTAGVMSGQVQALQISVEIIQADLNGADLEYVVAPTTAIFFSLMSQPSIKTADDLRGKTVGATAVGTATYTGAELALRSLGLQPSDVTFISANNAPTVLAGLEGNALDAAVVGMPDTFTARDAGYNTLVDVSKLGIPYPSAWDVVSKQYARTHPDAVARYVKSIVQAEAFEIQHPQEAEQIWTKYGSIQDPKLLQESYDTIVPTLRRVPTPDAQGVQNALTDLAATLPQAATADPQSFMDAHFVQDLQDSGFIDSLYP